MAQDYNQLIGVTFVHPDLNVSFVVKQVVQSMPPYIDEPVAVMSRTEFVPVRVLASVWSRDAEMDELAKPQDVPQDDAATGPLLDWRYEVVCGYTQLGFAEWCEHKAEEAGHGSLRGDRAEPAGTGDAPGGSGGS